MCNCWILITNRALCYHLDIFLVTALCFIFPALYGLGLQLLGKEQNVFLSDVCVYICIKCSPLPPFVCSYLFLGIFKNFNNSEFSPMLATLSSGQLCQWIFRTVISLGYFM